MKHPLITKTCSATVRAAADKLAAVLDKRGIKLFARIDHADAARQSGMELADLEVLIFGDPKVGTFLMQECAPVGIELPLKIAIWNDGETRIGYREPKELLDQYDLEQHREIVLKMSSLMAALCDEVVKA
jgi:beta-galactosidase